jgi:hypothetical protein
MPSDDSPESVSDLDFYQLPATVPPTVSPYGDNWDLLWIGHCGMHFPFSKTVPKGRIIRLNDETVAPKRNQWVFNIPFTLKEKYPEHTRAYHHAQEGVCALGYALSQRGARKLLHEVALKDVSAPFDILLRWYCEGDKGRAPGRQCLTTQPSLFRTSNPNFLFPLIRVSRGSLWPPRSTDPFVPRCSWCSDQGRNKLTFLDRPPPHGRPCEKHERHRGPRGRLPGHGHDRHGALECAVECGCVVRGEDRFC